MGLSLAVLLCSIQGSSVFPVNQHAALRASIFMIYRLARISGWAFSPRKIPAEKTYCFSHQLQFVPASVCYKLNSFK